MILLYKSGGIKWGEIDLNQSKMVFFFSSSLSIFIQITPPEKNWQSNASGWNGSKENDSIMDEFCAKFKCTPAAYGEQDGESLHRCFKKV